MEIITLLKANIRHKKGSFASIIILMILISMSLTAILSINDNCTNSINNAMEKANVGDLNVYFREQNLTPQLMQTIENNDMVGEIEDLGAVVCNEVEVGDEKDGNSWFMMKLRPEIKLFNIDLNGYEDEVPPLKSGEIYITQGVCTNRHCKVGDIINAKISSGDIQLKIAGVIVEPTNGASQMGWKQVFISDEDFEKFSAECKATDTEDETCNFRILRVFKSADCTLADPQFKRQLNLETGIIDNSIGSLTKTQSAYYTSLFPDIICSVLMVFISFLMVVVLIVMGHSISTGIEMDYVNLGVLKSQGFTRGKIQIIYAMQYLSAQIMGAFIGVLLAIPLINALGNVFQPITAILNENHISLGKSLLIMLGVLIISAIFIVIITRKVGRISPVKAISGGREEIYFDSRIKAPISKKMLSPSLALRQFTSNKRQYIGIILIVTILVFFMTTVMVLGDSVNSKSALESMGQMYTEVDVDFNKNAQIDDNKLAEFDKTVEEFSAIENKYYASSMYLSLDGEELYCAIYKNPDAINGMNKGRAPLYDNEVVITNIVADELGLKLGDTVTVAHNDKKSEYIISGFNQNLNDTGRCFSMSLEGAKKIGIEKIYFAGYSLADPSKADEIVDVLNDKFGDIITAEAISLGPDETFNVAITGMKLVIYFFSVIFTLVVVHMVCSKTFLREKTDIGIFKALGFTSGKLRLQFAVRFLIVAIIGSAFGSLLSMLLSGEVLSKILVTVGISSFKVEFTPLTFIIPITLVCVCFFLFAFIASRKIKRVEVKELVVE